MWASDSIWFEISIVNFLFVIGNILLGHFEEKTPKLRRIGKYILTLTIVICLSHYASRAIAMIVLALSFIPVFYIHLVSLPKNGINGWTGEPKEKYYELRGWNKNSLDKK